MDKNEKLLMIAMEECAELIQAISKQVRYGNNQENLCEEIADVELCINWIIKNCELSDEMLNKWREFKKKRLEDRKLYD